MFGVGMPELLLIILVAVIFIGPQDIPHVMLSIAKIFRQIKSVASDFNKSLEVFLAEAELNEIVKDANKIVDDDEFEKNLSGQSDVESKKNG